MELKTGIIDIGTFNKLYLDGTIYPYKNNRGGKIYDPARVRKYAAAWDSASSGCAVLEKIKDGYMLRDFHNRAEAIKLGVSAGKISPKETILIRVLPPGDGLSAYRKINSAQKHSSVDKYKNVDLAIGNQISKVLVNTSLSTEKIPAKFYQQVALAVIDLKIKKRSEYAVSGGSHHQISRFIDSPAVDSGEVDLKPAEAKAIAGAVNYWTAVRDEAESKSSSNVVEKIFKSSSFFGFVIFDFMFKRKLKDASNMADNLIKKQRKVQELARGLSLGSQGDRLDAQNALVATLTS